MRPTSYNRTMLIAAAILVLLALVLVGVGMTLQSKKSQAQQERERRFTREDIPIAVHFGLILLLLFYQRTAAIESLSTEDNTTLYIGSAVTLLLIALLPWVRRQWPTDNKELSVAHLFGAFIGIGISILHL